MEIPDGEILYKYARPDAFPPDQDEIPPYIFNDPELSCDWAQHQKKPDQSFHVTEGKTIVVSISVCDEIRNPRNPKRAGQTVPDWKQSIIHDPVPLDQATGQRENYSHSLIKGKKKFAVTNAIARNSTWEEVEAPSDGGGD